MRLPLYRLTIKETDEGMDFVGLVDYPAHSKKWIAMSDQPKEVRRYAFNEEKQIVKGVVLSTYQPIYRRDSDGFEYNVYFSADDSQKILEKFATKGYHNNVNLMHDMNQKVDNVGLIEMIVVNEKRSNIPEEFADQNLQKGSIIFAYKVNDAKTWEFIKTNGAGFSLEGWFSEVEIKFNKPKNRKMKKEKGWLLKKLGFATETKHVFDTENKDKYAEAVTADGITLMWEGDLIEGVALWEVPAEGEPVLAVSGPYTFDVDGVSYTVETDESGTITSVVEDTSMEDLPEEIAEAMTAMKAHFEGDNAKLAKENKELESKVVEMAKQIEDLTEAVERFADIQNPKPAGTGNAGDYRSKFKRK